MSEQQQQPTTTEAASNSPIPASAKAGLEKALSHRPDREDLVNRNILPDSNVAPALQAAKKELERSRLEDQLENFIKNRPDAEKLVKEGVLQQDEVPPSS